MTEARRGRWILRILLLALGGLGFTSCGYSSGVRPPVGYESIAVTVFDNLSPQPEVERDLFLSLSSQASRMIDGKIMSPSDADVVVRGTIVDYRRLSGILSRQGDLQQSGVRLILRAWLEDRRTGSRMGDEIQVDQAVRYVIRAGEEEFGARRTALAHLSQELILDLFTQLDYGSAGSSDPVTQDEIESLEPLAPQTLDPRVQVGN